MSASAELSTSVTGMPALAKHMAMPPPMVPAPITAARLISRGFTSLGQVRRPSPPRARRRRDGAAPSIGRPTRSSTNSSRSRFSASSNGIDSAFAHGLQARHRRRVEPARALGRWRDHIRRRLRIGARRGELVVAVAQRAERTLLRDARWRAKAIAAGEPDRLRRSRRSGRRQAPPSRRSGRRDRIISSAFSGPTRRGSRAVPPAPGSRPSLISGRPEPCARRRDAEMAAERELEAAAQRRAVDRRDRRLRHFVERGDQVE